MPCGLLVGFALWFSFEIGSDGPLAILDSDMPFPFFRAGALAALSLYALAQVAHAGSCLSSSGTANAEGLVTIGSTDAKAKPYILKLSKSVCLDAADAADSVKNAREIHIFSSTSSVHSSIGRFVGRQVIVRGRAFPAHTRYHHASIVMDVEQVE